MRFKIIQPLTPIAGSLLGSLLLMACSTPAQVETQIPETGFLC
jgi:hypothetical protein